MPQSTALLMVVNTLLPLLGLWWLLSLHRAGRKEWVAKVVLVAAYLFAVSCASVWLVPSVYAPYVYATLFVLVLPLSWLGARKREWPLATPAARARFTTYLLLTAVFIVVGVLGALAHRTPAAPTVALDFPLRDGRFYVADRSQALGLEIVAVDRLGQRSSGLRPRDPEAYTIFGMPVHAPCDGEVKRVVDGAPDGSLPQAGAGEPSGNLVVLACGPAQVVLSHLRNGSIEVRAGDAVKRGDRIGAVGASGRTTEPHLAVRAQAANGQPLAMTFDGQILSRGLVRPDR